MGPADDQSRGSIDPADRSIDPADDQSRGSIDPADRAIDPADRATADELVALIALDDRVRARLAATGALFATGYHPAMEAVHRANAARLRAIIDAVGWPGRARFGPAAASAAWRIVQHAIGLPAFVRAMLPLVTAAAARGDADPAEHAMLEDRIRVNEGRPQRYGTQSDWDDAGTAMVPTIGVEDPAGVDARRAAVGLPPIVWRRPAPPDQPPPAYPAARRAEMDAWARRTGWR